MEKLVAWFEELSKEDVGLAGGKGANLGEMTRAGIPVPPGFVVTAHAYQRFLRETGLIDEIRKILKEINIDNPEQLRRTAEKIQKMIVDADVPNEIREEIERAYEELCRREGEEVFVACRSSATAEDIPEASFAGMQATFLNVRGKEQVVEYVKRCWASLFTPRAIFYREKQGFEHEKVSMSVVVQKMVNARSAGVMFTIHPTTGEKDKIVIEGSWGLGEAIVAGLVTPDRFVVSKDDFRILEKSISSKKVKIIRKEDGGTTEVEVPEDEQDKPCLSDEEVVELARIGARIEEHYGFPQDIEWAVEDGRIFILQSRPVTVIFEEEKEEAAEEEAEILVKGLGASPGIAYGTARVIMSLDELDRVQRGDILVTKMTTPDWVPAMQRAAAIVTDEGGMTCHAAIVSRELGIPAVVGTGNATKVIKDGMKITVDGTRGVVYKGLLKEAVKAAQSSSSSVETAEAVATAVPVYAPPVTATEVKVNLSIPDLAEKVARETQADGVGLLRAEHMLLTIGKHPRVLIREGGEHLFIDRFADGIRKVAKAFYPKKVWYRTLDLKTDEFKSLPGGEEEPDEPNPMLGWRGVRRFVDERYPEEIEILKLELKAIKKVVDEGFKNIGVMIPMVHDPSELRKFKKIVEEVGLKPHEDIQIGIMVEIPSAALMIEEFCKEGIDFVSFGTNDLTQYTLAIDRNNERIAHLYNEAHPAVLKLIKHVIDVCKKYGVETSICGQAGSDPKYAAMLVRMGIDSISANPDAVRIVREAVAREERRMLLEAARKLNMEE